MTTKLFQEAETVNRQAAELIVTKCCATLTQDQIRYRTQLDVKHVTVAVDLIAVGYC